MAFSFALKSTCWVSQLLLYTGSGFEWTLIHLALRGSPVPENLQVLCKQQVSLLVLGGMMSSWIFASIKQSWRREAAIVSQVGVQRDKTRACHKPRLEKGQHNLQASKDMLPNQGRPQDSPSVRRATHEWLEIRTANPEGNLTETVLISRLFNSAMTPQCTFTGEILVHVLKRHKQAPPLLC